MSFIVFVLGAAWKGRRLIIGWSALALAVFLMLEAIRFNLRPKPHVMPSKRAEYRVRGWPIQISLTGILTSEGDRK